MSCFIILLLTLSGFVLARSIPESFIDRQILWLSFLFLATMPIWGGATTLGQIFLAREMPYVNLLVTAIASILSLFAAMLCVPHFGPVAIAWIEIAMLFIIGLSYFIVYQRTFCMDACSQGNSLGPTEK